MNSPLVSVCIPTFNGERYLRKTIESVLNQDWPHLEVIIADDASSDGTMRVVDELRDERFSVIKHTESIGPEGNWNAACAAANGEFIKLLCQDDLLMGGCLTAQVRVLQDNPSASFAWSPRDVISPKGRRILRSRGYIPSDGTVTFQEVARHIVRSGTNPFGEPCAVLMRASSERMTGGFSGSYLIDLEMWVDLLRSAPAVHSPETLSQFRVSSDSWTSQLRRVHALEHHELASRLAAEMPELISTEDVATGARRAKKLQRRRSALLALVTLLRL